MRGRVTLVIISATNTVVSTFKNIKFKEMENQAVLKWSLLTVSGKIIKARTVVAAMTGNANFEAPNTLPDPALAVVSAAADALEGAEEMVEENGGGVKWTNIRNNREAELNKMMSQMLKYVSFVAKSSSEVILSAAMELKKLPVRKRTAAPKKAE